MREKIITVTSKMSDSSRTYLSGIISVMYTDIFKWHTTHTKIVLYSKFMSPYMNL